MEEINGIGIGGKPFKLHLSAKEFANEDVIQGKRLMKIIGEPEQVVMEIHSRWWIVRMWRKLWGIKKTESTWMYTVKLIEDGKGI